MPWLRLDDGFTEHRKILALKRSDRWTWLQILTYCARQSNGGKVPPGISDVIRQATPSFIQACLDAGLLDPADPVDNTVDNGYVVHDWLIYNGETIEERVRSYVRSHPHATRNEVVRAVGGNRGAVLAEVARLLDSSQTSGTTEPPDQYQNGTETVPKVVPDRFPIGSPAQVRSPTPTPTGTATQHQGAAAAADDEPDDEPMRAAGEAAQAAGWTRAQQRAIVDVAAARRALALIAEAGSDPTAAKPGALAWTWFRDGREPGAGAPAPTVAEGAQGGRSRKARLLPHGPCAVDGCDHRAASAEALAEHRRNVHDVGEPEPVQPPPELLALLGTRRRPAEPAVELDA